MNGVIAMHGMDAVRRAARWSAGMWLAAALIALGPAPHARAEVPSLPAIAATNAAQSVSKRTVAVPPLIAAPAAYVDASDSETPDDQTLLDDPAADSNAQDSDSDDLVGDAADAAGDDASNWLTMLGLDQILLPWVGDREMADSPTRPLLIPDNKRVDSVVRYFLTKRRRVLEVGYRRSTRYLSTIRTIFTEAGIPPKLAYLAAVESNYNPIAHSRARAAGMWQFMSFTAKKYGLKVRLPWYDERLDPVYSTRAAARLLAYLHDEYGSWELALAAYNAGEGRVNRAIRRAQQPEGQEDYWTLRRLPRETKGYVPAFFALARIYEDPETYGLDHLEQDPEVELEAIEIDVSTSLAELAKLVDIPYEELRRLNPAWKRGFIP
ncbi:MAG TPA: lytic transglycosylase domain-containing protein, partial [bacterium]